MAEKIMIKILIFIIFFFNQGYALQITEIFYKTGAYFQDEDRYIEIFNDDNNSFNLSNLILVLPKDQNSTTNIKVGIGKFDIQINNVITDSMILDPGQFAVILSEEYSKNARLFAFSSNSLIVKPRNQAFTAYSWAGQIPVIKLAAGGKEIFGCGLYYIPPDSSIGTGDSLSLTGKRYEISKPTPGINNGCMIYSDSQIIGNGPVKIFYKDTSAVDEIVNLRVKYSEKGNVEDFSLFKDSNGIYSGTYFPQQGLSHGEEILFSVQNNNWLIRFLESEPVSPFNNKIIINELVTDPKSDYSGGGWTGLPGPGKPGSSDDWIEVANVSGDLIYLTNFYLLVKNNKGEKIKKLNIKNIGGITQNTGCLAGYDYAVATVDGGLDDEAFIEVYDGNPLISGKKVDQIEYGDKDITGDGIFNNAPSGNSDSTADEAIARIPNAVFDTNYKIVFKKQKPSFAKNNTGNEVQLWVRDIQFPEKNSIWLTDTNNTGNTALVTIRNDVDFETFYLTNYKVFFYAAIPISDAVAVKNDGLLQVENGMCNEVLYLNSANGKKAVSEFYYVKKGWNMSIESENLNNVLVYPNPAPAGKEVQYFFVNLPADETITVIDHKGNTIKELNKPENGVIIWKAKLKSGIYFVFFKNIQKGKENHTVKKLLVLNR